MREHEVTIPTGLGLAGRLSLPDDALSAVPAVLLIAGSGADTRDGDLELPRPAGTDHPPGPGTIRRIASHLASSGVASLRWDRRGFGASGGDPDEVDYDTDLEDAAACFSWLQARPEVDPWRVGVAGHSAGALTACRLCRDAPEMAAAALLGALASPIEDLVRRNLGRYRDHWDDFTAEQREWLARELPAPLVLADKVERLLDGARAGEDRVRLEGHGVVVVRRTARLRQDLDTDYAAEFGHVSCPALVLHGGDDLNVEVDDTLVAYRALRRAGNADVRLVVIPGLDRYFIPVAADPARRLWERVSLEALRRPMATDALDVLAGWAVRALSPTGHR